MLELKLLPDLEWVLVLKNLRRYHWRHLSGGILDCLDPVLCQKESILGFIQCKESKILLQAWILHDMQVLEFEASLISVFPGE